ncbi:mechanosensitive ion channel family protein [Aquabacterium sp.]|uniref:mechanosensitive ion channel family protein n=1 Tax=Aquabacterium sp. TaxID=1872578 RepID=UPI002D055593|nr:mechanosensitive ion channel domain-containing protein [Aquabacterium sp.]HSW04258.1 mechanosensitive ion channel domain-containing protein [Aquabacterium sp.]
MLDSLPKLLEALLKPSVWIEVTVIATVLLLAWGLAWWLRPRAPAPNAGDALVPATGRILFGDRGFDGVLFPLLALGGVLLARLLLKDIVPFALFKLAVPLLASLAIIRVVARVLHVAFPGSRVMRALERTLSWLVWLALVLWLTDLLPLVLAEMDAVHWKISGSDVSLRGLFEGALSAAVVLVLVLWLSASIEARLLAADSVNLSVRKIAANGTRAGLLLVGLLVALSVAGIPLGALSVMGGAIGVGIGFGLQKLAANYVSGFVILAERSLRIGDTVRVDNFEGRITDITTRYTVIRASNGRESIVPNEMLITQRVENSSFADSNIAVSTVVQVAYGSDLDALMPRLASAVAAVPRVLAEPVPSVELTQFAADGLELKIVFWINDLNNGQGNVRSAVNLAVLRSLNAAGVEIPFPHRVVRHIGDAAPLKPAD